MRYKLTEYRQFKPFDIAIGTWDAIQAVVRLYGDATDVTSRGDWSDTLVAKYFVTTKDSFRFLEVTVHFDGWEGCTLPSIMGMLRGPQTDSYGEPERFCIFDARNRHEDPIVQ